MTIAKEVIYSEQDGNPLSDNTLQFYWLVLIVTNLQALFQNNPNVFIAGDLLWYPVEGDNLTRTAPDTMVVFGRPKGYRKSYLQWQEGNIPPQVVFEILSPGNRAGEMQTKKGIYERFGVEEYYLYDPDREKLQGWQRQNGQLVAIPQMNGWVSPRLGIRFEMGTTLTLYYPDGRPFADFVELDEQRQQAEQQIRQERQATIIAQQQAERERQATLMAEQRVAKERQAALAAQQQADQERQRAEEMARQLEQLKAKLKEAGLPFEE